MTTRRDFLDLAMKNSVCTAAAALIPGGASASPVAGVNGFGTAAQETDSDSKGVHYKPPFKFGIGGVPFGNEFSVITDNDAHAAIAAAWDAGVRYFDMAPWYGLGLAERRFGYFLHGKPREEFVVSSKVGKLLKASKSYNRDIMPMAHSPNNVVFDYTGPGVRRSIEDSLQRLGLDSLDIVFVHDLSADNTLLPTSWQAQFEIARNGAFPELTRMREEGLIKGWGIGVNTPEPILRLLQIADPDICLLASQYSLIDHKNALNNVFPVARAKGVSFVIGSSLNAGFISGSARYNYGKNSYNIPQQFIEKRRRLHEVAADHGVDLRTAALRFSAAPDVASALVVGVSNEQQALEDVTSMSKDIPAEFWDDLKAKRLIEPNAPIPA
jgi:D-threo-aldose 1-dehydrogenase